jgi:hypothetical protein
MKKVIAICASVSHYEELIQIEKDLKNMGFKVLIPDTLRTMQKSNNFDPDFYKTWFKNANDYKVKTRLINKHFRKIEKSDAILIANFPKNGLVGYIGGNVLMEATLAYYLNKKIFILNQIDKKLSFEEEIYALGAKFLEGNLKEIKV